MNRLSGKVCLVTGAASGLGNSIAEKFAEEGARVVILDLAREAGEAAAEALRVKGAECLYLYTNVTSAEDWSAAVAAVLAKFGRIDVLVNNTGIFKEGDALQASEADFCKIMSINTTGTFLGMQAVLPQMVAQKSGCRRNRPAHAGQDPALRS